ncbi:ABC transporter substrate-binding protein [Paracoccus onubensis]|nr:ABC transporter substrate-binding protein [Paracoccus onubensis]
MVAQDACIGPGAYGPGAGGLSRRALIGGLTALAALCPCGSLALPQPAPRIVALDAPATEMLVALGRAPIGAAGLAGYRQAQGDLPLLRDAVDIGFFHEPNLELLQALSPDLFIGSFGIGAPVPALERIAPVISIPIYGGETDSFTAAETAMRRTGEVIAETREAEAFLRDFRAEIDALRGLVRTRKPRPVYLASPLLDGRHMILYGTSSLFDQVMRRAGLQNAFTGETTPWGIATLGVEKLTDAPDATLLYIRSPVTDVALDALSDSAIWRRLPFVRQDRVTGIPYLEMYGALPTARHFTAILSTLIREGALDAG